MKKLLTLLTLSSLVVLAGCSSAELPTNTNETGGVNTNTQVVVADTNSDSNTNEVVNENANTNSDVEVDEVDTSDWNYYVNEKYAEGKFLSGDMPLFSIRYPFDWKLDEQLSGPFFFSPSLGIGDLPRNIDDIQIEISMFRDQNNINAINTAEDCAERYNEFQTGYTSSNESFLTTKTNIKMSTFDVSFGTSNIKQKMYCTVYDHEYLILSAKYTNSDLIKIFDAMVDTFKFQ